MKIHPEINDILNKIVREVCRATALQVPAPTTLRIGGMPVPHLATAQLYVNESGYLTAEYFTHNTITQGKLSTAQWAMPREKVTIQWGEEGPELPIDNITESNKTRTRPHLNYPALAGFNLELNGWIGPETALVNEAHLTLNNLPSGIIDHRGRMPMTDEDTGTWNIVRKRDTQTALAIVLTTEEGWIAEIRASEYNRTDQYQPLHRARVYRKDQKQFQIDDDSEAGHLINAVRLFLSFQTGRWIEVPTIMGATPEYIPERACIGRVFIPGQAHAKRELASDFHTWPMQFPVFWELYRDQKQSKDLWNVVGQYVRHTTNFRANAIGAIDDVFATLEAMTKWWRPKKEDEHLIQKVMSAVTQADLRTRDGRTADTETIEKFLKSAYADRNDATHGRIGKIISEKGPATVVNHMYCHNLARLMILAKMNDRTGDMRGFMGPMFHSEAYHQEMANLWADDISERENMGPRITAG